MPYNVSGLSGDRTERVYCETAGKALSEIRRLNDDGRTQVRATSVEGSAVSVDRLIAIARGEAPTAKPRSSFG